MSKSIVAATLVAGVLVGFSEQPVLGQVRSFWHGQGGISAPDSTEIMIIDDWASKGAMAHIVDDELPAKEPRAVPTDEALLDLVRERCHFIRDREEARKIAQMFKSRHHDYLRALADIRGRIDKVLK